MKINRKDLLQKLLCVKPGISKQKSIHQSSCFALRKGRLYTLSQEISCSMSSDLPEEWEGAIQAERFLDLMKLIPEDEIDMDLEDHTLFIKSGRGRKSKLVMEREVVLPIDSVEKPGPKSWKKLPQDFSEAVDLVQSCTRREKESPSFLKECVHICPEWMEACDNLRLARYQIESGFIQEPVLVRGESLKTMIQLGMTMVTQTQNWLHFHSPVGLRLSVRKYLVESYPDLGRFLFQGGKKVSLPRSLQGAIQRAGLFASGGSVSLKLSDGRILIEGQDILGQHSEVCQSVGYEGPIIGFLMPVKLLGELVERHTSCEVCENTIRVQGDHYTYVCSIEKGKGQT